MDMDIAKFKAMCNGPPIFTRDKLSQLKADMEQMQAPEQNGLHLVPHYTPYHWFCSYLAQQSRHLPMKIKHEQRIGVASVEGKETLAHKRRLFRKSEEWYQNSTQLKQLLRYLQKNLQSLAPVRKIVCFGLGSPQKEKSAYQHTCVRAIAETIDSFYGSESAERVRIFSQDPVYKISDRAILSEGHYPFHIVDDPDGFLEIDENTLVVSLYACAPIRQIVADLALEIPLAGILCNTIDTRRHFILGCMDMDTESMVGMVKGFAKFDSWQDDGDEVAGNATRAFPKGVSLYCRKKSGLESTELEEPGSGWNSWWKASFYAP